MKHLFLLVLVPFSMMAANGQNVIEWRKDKVTQLIFPAEIVKFRTGYIASPTPNCDAMTQSEGKVLYIQPVIQLNETNLNVITSDGCYYAFNLIYNDTADRVNYIITSSMSFYQEEVDKSALSMPNEHPVQESTEVWRDSVQRASVNPLFAKVEKHGDYIVTNNVAKLQKIIFVLKGVYVDQSHVFFKFSIENNGNIPFDIDYIAFSISARKTKKTSTQERLQILPIEANVDVHRVGAKSFCEVIYCFDKFTIGKDKVLLAEVLELGGDRNIGLRISEAFIIEARKI